MKILLESRGCKADYTTKGEPVSKQTSNLRCPLPGREWKIFNGLESHVFCSVEPSVRMEILE